MSYFLTLKNAVCCFPFPWRPFLLKATIDKSSYFFWYNSRLFWCFGDSDMKAYLIFCYYCLSEQWVLPWAPPPFQSTHSVTVASPSRPSYSQSREETQNTLSTLQMDRVCAKLLLSPPFKPCQIIILPLYLWPLMYLLVGSKWAHWITEGMKATDSNRSMSW